MDQINLKDRINRLFDNFTEKFLLPDKSFSITENFSQTGTNAGKLISTELDIVEHSYPPDTNNSVVKTALILYIKPNPSFFELLVRHDRLSNITIPETAQIKNVSDKLYVHVLFDFNDENILDFISSNILYSLNSYTSSSTFGCCSHYAECSKKMQCVHSNTLYAKGCQYRRNLENGIVFY